MTKNGKKKTGTVTPNANALVMKLLRSNWIAESDAYDATRATPKIRDQFLRFVLNRMILKFDDLERRLNHNCLGESCEACDDASSKAIQDDK